MKLTADYHTHTIFSHGTGSVDDNVRAALDAGLSALGIADHSIAHIAYGVKRRRIGEYLKSIEEAKRRYDGRIEVKAGIELNLIGLDGSVDMPDGRFDMLILGYHKTALCRDFKTLRTFVRGSRHIDAVTQAYMRAVQRHRIDIVAHPGYGVPVDFRRLAQACADYGTLFEINNKHEELEIEDLRLAAQTEVRFVLSSDAHAPQAVGRVPNAVNIAEKAGIALSRVVNISEE